MAIKLDLVQKIGELNLPLDSPSYKWVCVAGGDLDGQPLIRPDYPDKTIGSYGTTLNGKTATAQGSRDGTTWFTLKDLDGTSIQFTGIGQEFLIKESPPLIRILLSPDSTGVDFSIGVTCVK